jgi:hypothetical protein
MVASLNSYVNEYEIFFTVLNGGRIGVSFNVGKIQYAVQKSTSEQLTYTNPIVSKNMFSFELTPQLEYMLGLKVWVVHPEVLATKKSLHNIVAGYNDNTMTMIKYMLRTYRERWRDGKNGALVQTFYGKWLQI